MKISRDTIGIKGMPSSAFSILDLIQCARRELGQRKRVYRRLVSEGRMEPAEAEREIALMQAIRENLESQQQRHLF